MNHRRRRRRHAQLHLPPLSGAEASLLLTVCARLTDALWRAHGDAIAEHGADLLPLDPRPCSLSELLAEEPDARDDDPF
jgi:hypothetical protein